MAIEYRGKWIRQPLELRSEGGVLTVAGYAAVFNQRANISDMFEEQIAPGAFREALLRDDTIFNFNHDDNTVMARVTAGNLRMSEDDRGLKIEAKLDESDPDVVRIAAKMRAGNLDKMSFAFRADEDEWDDTGDIPLRTIRSIGYLHDVSIVTTPAYDGTEIGMRSLDQYRQALHERQHNFSAVRRRLRMKANLAKRENGPAPIPDNTQHKEDKNVC